MKRRLLTIVVLSANLFCVGCADDQARTQIADTNIRVIQLEQTVGVLGSKVSNEKMLDILNKLDNLQSQIDEINGNLSAAQHDQQVFQNTQNQVNQSVEQQLQSLGATSASLGTNNSSSSSVVSSDVVKQISPPMPVNQDRIQLNAALKKIKAHNFTDAIKQLKLLITSSKNPDIVASANYYLAVAYAANGEYKNSIWVARKFVEVNPKSKNAPDALYTMYISQQQLGMKTSAASTAKQIRMNYPNSTAAKKL